MEIIINIKILRPLFEEPRKSYFIREIAKIICVNHTTVGQYLRYLEKEGIVKRKKEGIYPSYSVVLSKKFLNLKLFYNLEKLRESKLIEDLQKFYDFPVIVLFGSYAKAMDDLNSDLDICLVTEVEKEFKSEKYEKSLNRKVSLYRFNKNKWDTMKEKNKELINSICNGIVLCGELEVI